MRILIVLILLATCAGAVPVDPYAANGIAAMDRSYFLCTSGEVMMLSWGNGTWTWHIPENQAVPIPVDQISNWTITLFIDTTGAVWTYEQTGDAGLWQVAPPSPCTPPVRNDESNFSDVKSMFR